MCERTMNRTGWLAFVLLCGWTASQWLVPNEPSGGAGFRADALLFGLAGLIGVFLVVRKGVTRNGEWTSRVGFVAASVLFFSAPLLLVSNAQESVPATNIATIFAAG